MWSVGIYLGLVFEIKLNDSCWTYRPLSLFIELPQSSIENYIYFDQQHARTHMFIDLNNSCTS